MKLAIRAENVSKLYRIGTRSGGGYRTLREAIANASAVPWNGLRRLSRRGIARGEHTRSGQPPDSVWAVKDVSFDVRPGEVLGIIGRNGAGKSTLLKIISRITEPTSGRVEIRGRVRSLLEVGTGFHPELTGRENIFLNGVLLGMSRREVVRKFDEIVAFAEVDRFLDTPVKRYSSGMYVRLAFGVAAFLEPEILIVDEVLAVGDANFQNKCLGKMEDVARCGRTVIFVSHNLQLISSLTNRAIVMDAGRPVFDGGTQSAMARYRSLWGGSPSGDYEDPEKEEGVVAARVLTSEPNNVHRSGEPLKFEFDLVFLSKPIAGAFSFQIVDEQSRPIAHLWLVDSERPWSGEGKVRLRCILPSPRLYMGRYSLVTHLGDRSAQELHESLQEICRFEVVMDGIYREYDWSPGACTYLEDGVWDVE